MAASTPVGNQNSQKGWKKNVQVLNASAVDVADVLQEILNLVGAKKLRNVSLLLQNNPANGRVRLTLEADTTQSSDA